MKGLNSRSDIAEWIENSGILTQKRDPAVIVSMVISKAAGMTVDELLIFASELDLLNQHDMAYLGCQHDGKELAELFLEKKAPQGAIKQLLNTYQQNNLSSFSLAAIAAYTFHFIPSGINRKLFIEYVKQYQDKFAA